MPTSRTRSRRLPRDDVVEQHEARFVGPLQVVEHQDDRLLLGHRGEQADGRREQEEPLRVGVGGLRRRELRYPAGQCRHDAGELRSVRFDVRAQPVLRRVRHVVPDASAKSWYGVARSSSQWPNSTHAPSSKAARAAAAAIVVFPSPASPETRITSRPSPRPTRCAASAMTSCSALVTDHTHGRTDREPIGQRNPRLRATAGVAGGRSTAVAGSQRPGRSRPAPEGPSARAPPPARTCGSRGSRPGIGRARSRRSSRARRRHSSRAASTTGSPVAVVCHEVHVAGAHADAQHEPLQLRDAAVATLRRLLHRDGGAERIGRGVEDRHQTVAGRLHDPAVRGSPPRPGASRRATPRAGRRRRRRAGCVAAWTRRDRTRGRWQS